MLYLLLLISLLNSIHADCPTSPSCSDCLKTPGCGFCPNAGCVLINGGVCNSKILSSPYNCPKNLSIAYDENYVRNTVFPLIGATTASTENEILGCATKTSPDAQHIQRFNVTCSPKITDPCTADLYVFPSRRMIALVTHGSRTEEQYQHQIHQFLVDLQMKDTIAGGKALEYYVTGFDSLYNGGGLKTALQQLIAKYPGFTLLVTGHSLGGALATVAASTFVTEGLTSSNSIQLITFGSPRVGDATFGATVERLIPYRFRIVNQNDLGAEMPPLDLNDPNSPQHITFEVFYKTSMAPGSSYQVCPINEDPSCRNSLVTSDLAVHRLYFNVPIDSWYKSGCTS